MQKQLIPTDMKSLEIASILLEVDLINPNLARHMYSAILHIPGYDQLRFQPLLKSCKMKWNKSAPKYTDFWDGEIILKKLQKEALDWDDVKSVRDRLIMILRLSHLMRSVDLERMVRSISFQDGKTFVLLRRKGQLAHAWEEILPLTVKGLSPLHLLHRYVALTSTCVPSGGPVFLQAQKPFFPLKSSSIGGITKRKLLHFGVQNIFGAHSTRGAAVAMFKRLGLSSEQVCQ